MPAQVLVLLQLVLGWLDARMRMQGLPAGICQYSCCRAAFAMAPFYGALLMLLASRMHGLVSTVAVIVDSFASVHVSVATTDFHAVASIIIVIVRACLRPCA